MSARRRFRFSGPSLLTRVALALALVGLVPAAFIASRLIDINRDSMADQVDTTHALAARKIADGVGAYLETRLALAQGLVANAVLVDPRSEPARALLGRNLQAWAGLGVLALAVVDPEGERVILAQLRNEEVRGRVATAFDDPPLREVAAHVAGDRILVRVSVPLANRAGALWLIAEGEPLIDVLDAYELGAEAEVALVDHDGQAILGDVSRFPAQMISQARTGWLGGTDPSFRLGEGDADSVGAFHPVPLAEWAVLSRQPARVARAAEHRMRRQTGWALALSVVAVALLSTAAFFTVVRPIRRLAAAQRRLAGLGETAGGNEIDQLRSSFEALEQRLKERKALDEVFLGRYQIREVAGSGAMGTVFHGWDPKLQRPVALKTIRLDTRLEPGRRRELIDRLLAEAVMVAQFSHQNIVAVYDVEDRSEAAFVAMEYVDGESLESLIWRTGRLDADQALALGAAIARALATAHEHGMVHRDVKPANILLGRDGSIKVTDFGISELITGMSGREDVVFGTPGFLPPESLEGEGYGPSGDLFSLGVVLYYSVTGSRPFEGRTVRDVIRKTLAGRPAPPRRLVPALDPEFGAMILALLDKDPARRPPEASEVALKLERLAAARGAVWQPPEFDGESPSEASEGAAAQFVPTRKLTVGAGGRA